MIKMSSSRRYTPYESARQGSRWDRANKDESGEACSKRKLPSKEEPPKYSMDEEPEVKRTSMSNAQGFGFSMGQKNNSKISMTLGAGESIQNSSASAKTPMPIKLSLGASKPKEVAPAMPKPKTMTVAQAFNSDESSDDEEMPPEAKMRMRNLGKDTPTAAGPNSFGKNRLGFCDRQKVIQREIQKEMDKISKD